MVKFTSKMQASSGINESVGKCDVKQTKTEVNEPVRAKCEFDKAVLVGKEELISDIVRMCNNLSESLDDSEESICQEQDNPFDFFRIVRQDVDEAFTALRKSFWHENDTDHSSDHNDFIQLPPAVQFATEVVLAYFFSSDGIVFEQLGIFKSLVKCPNIKSFWVAQELQEIVHSKSYGRQIMGIVPNGSRLDFLSNAILNISVIQDKARWALAMSELCQRYKSVRIPLVAYICVEGIHFISSFAYLYWLQNTFRGKVMGIIKGNQLIARDEKTHNRFNTNLYLKHIVRKLPREIVEFIFKTAVDLEIAQFTYIMKEGMKREFGEVYVSKLQLEEIAIRDLRLVDMISHIEYQANSLLIDMGCELLYTDAPKESPFDFMRDLEKENKNNFFESRTVMYHKAHGVITRDDFDSDNDEDF